MGLAANPLVARFLISTPSRMVGTFSDGEIAIDHASPSSRAHFVSQVRSGPFSRSYYIVSVAHEKPAKEVAFPSYLINAELVADLASLWFGKCFEVHGKLQEHGFFSVPSFSDINPIEHHEAGPFSHKARKDLDIELSWNNFGRPMKMFSKYSQSQKDSIVGAFWRATRFYARSLRTIDRDPEVSFFHLIVAMEMLATGLDFTDDELLDQEAAEILTCIRGQMKDVKKVEKFIRARLFQLRQKVALTAVALTNGHFFEGSEAQHEFGKLDRDSLASAVKAAYDLRSWYAHEGANFGDWVNIFTSLGEEIHVGKPVIGDKKLENIVTKAPTWLGLERLVRYMALRFAHTKIVPINSLLGND